MTNWRVCSLKRIGSYRLTKYQNVILKERTVSDLHLGRKSRPFCQLERLLLTLNEFVIWTTWKPIWWFARLSAYLIWRKQSETPSRQSIPFINLINIHTTEYLVSMEVKQSANKHIKCLWNMALFTNTAIRCSVLSSDLDHA